MERLHTTTVDHNNLSGFIFDYKHSEILANQVLLMLAYSNQTVPRATLNLKYKFSVVGQSKETD